MASSPVPQPLSESDEHVLLAAERMSDRDPLTLFEALKTRLDSAIRQHTWSYMSEVKAGDGLLLSLVTSGTVHAANLLLPIALYYARLLERLQPVLTPVERETVIDELSEVLVGIFACLCRLDEANELRQPLDELLVEFLRFLVPRSTEMGRHLTHLMSAVGAARDRGFPNLDAALQRDPLLRATTRLALALERVCVLCGRAARVCSRCRDVRYCSAEHQRKDWPEHRPDCTQRGLADIRASAMQSPAHVSVSTLQERLRTNFTDVWAPPFDAATPVLPREETTTGPQ